MKAGRRETSAASGNPDSGVEALVARAKSFELPTEWAAPPGDPLHHHTAGFAKILCSAVFITGLDADFAAENIGYFTSDYDERSKVTKREIDMERKLVHLTLPDGVVRTAKYLGDQGCVTFPLGETGLRFEPVDVTSSLPDPDAQPWPMGDQLPDEPFPAELDAAKVRAAVQAAFEQAEGMTAAFVVTWKGRLIAERYRDGLDLHTPLESWSMGKSLTATLMGILIQQGVYDLWEPGSCPGMAGGRGSAGRDPNSRSPADVERNPLREPWRPGIRFCDGIPRPPLSLHRGDRLVQVGRNEASAVAAEQDWSLPEL